jgi:hypothetical protein
MSGQEIPGLLVPKSLGIWFWASDLRPPTLTMLKRYLITILSIFTCCVLAAQEANDSLASPWSFSTTGYFYFLPEEENTYTLLGYVDYKQLHMELRYNYEDQNATSIFAGWRFETGGKALLGITPMIGGVSGNTQGIIPALELDLAYRKFDFYSETEYVIDVEGKENNFLYVWGEVAISPIEPLRTGISYQKTRLYKTDREVQRGIFAQYSFWKLTAGVHYFNPFADDYFLIGMLSIEF